MAVGLRGHRLLPTRSGPELRSRRHVMKRNVTAASAVSQTLGEKEAITEVLRAAASKPGSVDARSLLLGITKLEKMKVEPEEWQDRISNKQGHWRLIYTASSQEVQAANKQQPIKGGVYFPLPGCQDFDGETFTNGIFLGPLAFLTFSGPYLMKGKMLYFDVVDMHIGVGPWKFTVPLKKASSSLADLDEKEVKKLPFFIYSLITDDVAVARGRSGGVALWGRAKSDWEAKAGVLRVYS